MSPRVLTVITFFFDAMIPLNDGYLGSLIFSITLITAGKLASIFSIPNSVDLAIETFEALGSTATLPAKVN